MAFGYGMRPSVRHKLLLVSMNNEHRIMQFLAERYYVTFALWHESSVCRLSVTLLQPTQRLQVFGTISAPPNSLGTRTVCNENFGKNSKGSR